MTSTTVLALTFVFQISTGVADVEHTGHVVAAPHGGYDEHSETIARSLANRLGWGRVTATGFRSYPYRHWFDVNRPTERPWRGRSFGTTRTTERGERVYEAYQDELLRAGRRTRSLDVLVEIHGHARQVRAGGRTLRLEVIELASNGFTLSQLRRIKSRYEELQRDLPRNQRVPLAIDRLDSRYVYRGWRIPFYFRASSAKRSGSLQRSKAKKSLHFELPPRVRGSSSARAAYSRLLARLIEDEVE